MREVTNIEPSFCGLCRNYAASAYLVCAIHPVGPPVEPCPDYDPWTVEQWEPEGAAYYNGELILQPPARSQAEQLAILDSHPLFTGTCPHCGYEFDVNNPPPGWECPECRTEGQFTASRNSFQINWAPEILAE